MNKEKFIFLTEILRRLSVSVRKEEIKKQLKAYYYEPNLNEFSNIFNTWGIKNLLVEIPLEMVEKAPKPMLSLTNDKEYFFIWEKQNENYVCFFSNESKYKTISKEELLSIWSGFSIILEANEDSGEINEEIKIKERKKNDIIKGLIITSFFSCIILSFFYINKSDIFFFIISIFGFSFSSYLLLREHSFFTQEGFDICKIGKKFDCDKVVSSKDSKLLGVSLSEMSVVFFLLLIVNTLINRQDSSVQFVLPLIYMSGLSIFYSLYQQLRLRTYCVMCLSIVLALSSLILFSYQRFALSFVIPNIEVLFSLAISILVTSLVINNLLLNEKSKKFSYRLDSFFNSPITSFGFVNSDIGNKMFENEIVIGENTTDFEIILFMNPECKRCKAILKNLSRLFLEFENSIQLRVLYSGVTDSNFKSKIMFFELFKSMEALTQKEKLFFLKNNLNLVTKKKELPKKIDESLTKQSEWSNELNLDGTPAIILNGVILPSFFGVEELSQLLREIINFNPY